MQVKLGLYPLLDLEAICDENEFNSTVECCLLQWKKDQKYADLENRFDYIICADWYLYVFNHYNTS